MKQRVIPGNSEETLKFCVAHWIETAKKAIQTKGRFYVALSGGSTPKKLFQQLVALHKETLDWSKVFVFWSDERAVPADDPESNYHMALVEGKLETLPIPTSHIFRLKGEGDVEQNAKEYEMTIAKVLQGEPFDLIMLGMGDDGHTASLFPHTKALFETRRTVVANYLPEKKVWRLTFTYPLIEKAALVCFYVMGEGKASMVRQVLEGEFLPEEYPSQKITSALWILDKAAASFL